MTHRVKSTPPKTPGLSDPEMAALRDVSNHRVVEPSAIQRLEKLGLVERKSGTWITTQQGQIRLMFRAAR
jgi:ribosomal protein S19E (S16A)